jgi:uroporphyrinogen-III synthase
MTAGRLAGIRVVVTRAAHQSHRITELLNAEAAQVEHLPVLEIGPPADTRPLERAASELALYHWVVFTSANAVEALLEPACGSLPAGLRIAAVGRATATALAEWELRPHLVPQKARAEGLIEELGPHVGRRQRVLLPQAADARPDLERGLVAAGAEVVRVEAYRKTVPAEAELKALSLFPEGGDWGWVTFTSPSTVRNLAQLLSARWQHNRHTLKAASIGPITSGALEEAGIEALATAATPTDEALVEAVATAAAD